jgi:F-type H+-transporting ATPase subunit gamma
MSGKQKEYKQRIKTASSLQKTFKAMELIASSKISKAKENATNFEPYDIGINNIISIVASYIKGDIEHKIFESYPKIKHIAILSISADRGMAGSFNSTIFRAVEHLKKEQELQGNKVSIYNLGEKGKKYFSFRNIEIKSFNGKSDAPNFETAKKIASEFLQKFGEMYSHIYVVYNHFINRLKIEIRVKHLLPVEIIRNADTKMQEKEISALYEFEPSARTVLNELLPKYLECRIMDFMYQSAASEMSARASSMHTANDNAADLIKKYTLISNKLRQDEITGEIIEIVSGASV